MPLPPRPTHLPASRQSINRKCIDSKMLGDIQISSPPAPAAAYVGSQHPPRPHLSGRIAHLWWPSNKNRNSLVLTPNPAAPPDSARPTGWSGLGRGTRHRILSDVRKGCFLGLQRKEGTLPPPKHKRRHMGRLRTSTRAWYSRGSGQDNLEFPIIPICGAGVNPPRFRAAAGLDPRLLLLAATTDRSARCVRWRKKKKKKKKKNTTSKLVR